MSQAGISGTGLIDTGIKTLTGNTGSATGETVNIRVGNPAGNGTAVFTASGSTVVLSFSATGANMGLGSGSVGGALTSGTFNVCLGELAGQEISSGGDNIGIGGQALTSLKGGSRNLGIGSVALANIDSGSHNVCLGYACGRNYTTTESSNILIGSNIEGTIGESHICRIGLSTGTGDGGLAATYIQGIHNVTLATPYIVTINNTTGQLGARLSSQVQSYEDIDTTPYPVTATDYYLSVKSSVGAITIQLPNAASLVGQTYVIKDRTGNAAANNITVTTVGGVINIDGATSQTISTNYGSMQVLWNGTSYEIYT